MESKKGNKKYGKHGNEGTPKKIDVDSPVLFVSGNDARKMIRRRNEEIKDLREMVTSLTKENIRMREELRFR